MKTLASGHREPRPLHPWHRPLLSKDLSVSNPSQAGVLVRRGRLACIVTNTKVLGNGMETGIAELFEPP